MTPYQLKLQNRRTLISMAAALLFHLLLVGGFFLYDYFFVEDLAEFSGPVLVKLGEPEGEDIPVLPEPEPPEAAPEEPPVPVSPPPVEELAAREPAVPAASVESSPEGTLPADQPTVDDAVDETPSEEPAAAEEAPARPQPETPSEPVPVIIKGEEGGNSYEFQYLGEEGLVSRSLSAEIYLYMPLPREVSMDVYNRMTGESYRTGMSRQKLFEQSYGNLNGIWIYENNPLPGDVTALWDYLIKAGYDYKNADYKSTGTLQDVVISFTLSENAELLDAKVQKSSGDIRVDDAVLEGFRAASFSNASGRKINGRFTYRFY